MALWHDCFERLYMATKKKAAKKAAPAKKKAPVKKAAKKKVAKKKAAAKKSSGPPKSAVNKLGVKNSLVNNINARKKKGISRKKKDSSIDEKQYGRMKENWGKGRTK